MVVLCELRAESGFHDIFLDRSPRFEVYKHAKLGLANHFEGCSTRRGSAHLLLEVRAIGELLRLVVVFAGRECYGVDADGGSIEVGELEVGLVFVVESDLRQIRVIEAGVA